jgi:hypothetical protein
VIVNARYYGDRPAGEPYLNANLHWFDPTGKLLTIWPPTPLNGNPEIVKGDWRGDGSEELFWYRFRMNNDGTGTTYFGEEVYHMFDFIGNGAEQVITLNKNAGVLRVYGCRDVPPKAARRAPDYMQRSVANHTHY